MTKKIFFWIFEYLEYLKNSETLKSYKKIKTLDRAKGFEVLNTRRVYLLHKQFFWLSSGLQILIFENQSGFLSLHFQEYIR